MDIAIIGAGVVGQATGKSFARLGHKVTFYDVDYETVDQLTKESYSAYHSGYLFAEGLSASITELIFVCVPESEIEANIEHWTIIRNLTVIRSTVPVGTCIEYDHTCHNPEFLREAVAEYEFMNPKKIIVGECCKKHGDLLEELYRPFNVPIVRTDPTTSEMIKLASNAYLATQVSFWNQIHLICEKLGINSHIIGKACSLDPRISEYGASMHGEAYGKKCLPKDLSQLTLTARKVGVDTQFLKAVKDVNDWMKVKK